MTSVSGRHLALVFITADLMLEAIGLKGLTPAARATGPQLPKGTSVVSVNYDMRRMGFLLAVEHPEFPLSYEGEELMIFGPIQLEAINKKMEEEDDD